MKTALVSIFYEKINLIIGRIWAYNMTWRNYLKFLFTKVVFRIDKDYLTATFLSCNASASTAW